MNYTASKSVKIIGTYGLITKTLAILLAKEKCFGSIDCYNSIEEYYAYNKTNPTDILLINLNFADNKSIEFIQKIKNSESSTVVIVLFSSKSEENYNAYLRMGADACISLEQSYDEIIAAIKDSNKHLV